MGQRVLHFHPYRVLDVEHENPGEIVAQGAVNRVNRFPVGIAFQQKYISLADPADAVDYLAQYAPAGGHRIWQRIAGAGVYQDTPRPSPRRRRPEDELI